MLLNQSVSTLLIKNEVCCKISVRDNHFVIAIGIVVSIFTLIAGAGVNFHQNCRREPHRTSDSESWPKIQMQVMWAQKKQLQLHPKGKEINRSFYPSVKTARTCTRPLCSTYLARRHTIPTEREPFWKQSNESLRR